MNMMKIWRNETSQLFDMQTFRLKFILVILCLIPGDECRTVTVQTGGSVIIPCHYESKYTQHKKYWCYDARAAYNYCSILAYANETNGDVSVIDHPDQSLFTVTMRDLQHQNTGYYWCAVEIKGGLDETEQLYITIQSAPDLSVMSSSVTVDEGGNISVQCLYTSTYKNKHKQWCRYKDKRCYTVGRSDTSQNASVGMSDDGRGSLTVVMSGLMKSDSGWYYCSVGDLQAPVHLTVNVAVRDLQTSVKFAVSKATSAVTSDNSSTRDMRDIQYDDLKIWLLPIVLLLLLILVTVTSVILRNKHKRKNNHITHEKKVSDEDDSVNSSSVNPECDVMYSSGIKLAKTEALSPADVEENVIYSPTCV
ncbi:polymeric immunoglobulin receptor-like [Paramisgurnus dabryanus]|uniref:polymeric immunoglobulin receptor-like n=1 Tax=Paramisgurnus dabryanus TaxID=90735 RepID=UPI0031F35C8C